MKRFTGRVSVAMWKVFAFCWPFALGDLVVERALAGTSFSAARRAVVVDNGLHVANGYTGVRRSGDERRFDVSYVHPIGGATVEAYTVVLDAAHRLIVEVAARSARAPRGLVTLVRVDLARYPSLALTTTASVAWQQPAPRLIGRRIEAAAERGASAAYDALARALSRERSGKLRPRKRRHRRWLPSLLGLLAAALATKRLLNAALTTRRRGAV